MYKSPQSIVEFEVRVPTSLWGQAMDAEEKVRRLVDRYTYSDSSIVDIHLEEQESATEDNLIWVVSLRLASHQPAATAVGITLNSQFERYLSGGLRPTLGTVYVATKEY